MKNNNFFFIIGNKHYFGKINNYLIIDFIKKNIGEKILFKKIIFFFNKKILLNDNGLNFKIFIIILKHFYIKTFSIKKRRRKNFIKKNINYKKKSLIFFQKII
ncbi:hypothetical protein ACJEC8_00380 [Candidatus Carsonella ruddii]|uniref:hypothetical protein n=1 Tax=Carsonella ruddii TaxID=114186 RepID=UPI003D551A4E